MTTYLSRRDFLRASALVSASVALNLPSVSRAQAQETTKNWYKCNLHMHNQWSDGKPLPEWAVDWYKSRGYHFICPSDHNIFQSDALRFDGFGFNYQPADKAAFKGETSLWKKVVPNEGWPNLTQRYVNEAIEKFGKDAVRIIKVGDATYVRMTPFAELCEKFCEPGKFLLMPGFEQTGGCKDGRQVHMNFLNVRESFPYIGGQNEPLEVLTKTFEEGKRRYAKDGAEPYLFTANHPVWRFYDFSPSDVIKMPEIRVFEVTNNGLDGRYKNPEDGAPWTPEKFWDVVNAWRASHGQRLLLGNGTDDRHGYESETVAGWTMVRSAKLETRSLIEAMDAGDMYASNGLDFADIQFDGKTLSVKIDVKEEGKYKIEFVGTKKDYNPEPKLVEVAESKTSPKRKIERFSDEIGVVLDAVEGTEGSYTLKADDLYVRAKIVKVPPQSDAWNARPAAWSQPYC